MLRKPIFKIAIFVFLFSSLSVFAQFLDYQDEAEQVRLIVGEVKSISVDSPTRLSVRDPDIIDIDPVSEKELVIVSKKAGSTALRIWDNRGESIVYVTVFAHDPEDLERKLKKLINDNLGIKNVRFEKNETTGKLMVMGEVTSVEKDQIEKVLSAVAESVDNLLVIREESKMVEVEVHILELTKNFSKTLGFDWTGTTGSSPTALTSASAASVTTKIRDIFRIIDVTRPELKAEFYAALSEGKGKILAKPKLLCLSGQEADFLVGGEIPVVTVTATASGDTVSEDVEYKEFGVSLNILPIVLGDDDIKLNLTTEVKELTSEGQYVRADGTVIRAFSTRNASTVLRLKPEQVVVISGLLKDKVTKDDINKVPGLGDIPILGALFRSKDYQDDQTELVITLVPRIVDSHKEAEEKQARDVQDMEKELGTTFPSKVTVYPEYLQDEGILNDYILKVQNMIFKSLDYPLMAKEAGWQGTVKIRLHINYAGEVLEARVTESSGYLSFDNNVLDIAKALSPYPPFPTSIDIEDLWIDIPIVYKLD